MTILFSLFVFYVVLTICNSWVELMFALEFYDYEKNLSPGMHFGITYEDA